MESMDIVMLIPKNASALTGTAAWVPTPKVAGSPEKASADDDSKSNGKDSDDSKTQNSKKAAKGQGAERFKRVSSKTSATSKLIACSATCSNDCGSKYKFEQGGRCCTVCHKSVILTAQRNA